MADVPLIKLDGAASDGQVPTADGAGDYAWETPPSGGGVAPLTEADTITITRGSAQVLAGTSYTTVLDVTSGGAEVIGGAIYSANIGIRITIDGTVVIDETTAAFGEDNAFNPYTVVPIPPISADSTLKIEVYNITGATDKECGWRIYQRS